MISSPCLVTKPILPLNRSRKLRLEVFILLIVYFFYVSISNGINHQFIIKKQLSFIMESNIITSHQNYILDTNFSILELRLLIICTFYAEVLGLTNFFVIYLLSLICLMRASLREFIYSSLRSLSVWV